MNRVISLILVGIVCLGVMHVVKTSLLPEENEALPIQVYSGVSPYTPSSFSAPSPIRMKSVWSGVRHYRHATPCSAGIGGYETMPMQSMRSTSSMVLPTTSSAEVVSIGSGGMYEYGRDLACNYTVSSSYNQRGISYTNTSVPHISGIITSASMVTGGVSSDETYSHMHGHVRTGHVPGECPYCHDDDDDGYCDVCGSDMIDHDFDDCPCRVPLECDWTVVLFITILSVLYVIVPRRKRVLSA